MNPTELRMNPITIHVRRWMSNRNILNGPRVALVALSSLIVLGLSGFAVFFKAPANNNTTGDDAMREATAYKTIFEKTDQPLGVARTGAPPAPTTPGVVFVSAIIQPIRAELDRFWGWRPNDLIRPTDNVNNFQRGVLEVTRATAVSLTRDLARSGSAEAFNPGLERAMNMFLVNPDSFWFPRTESKYRTGIREWEKYLVNLSGKKARFHTRPANLIPLLTEYATVLDGVYERLVRTDVRFFEADDHFYHAGGVASSMKHILEAVLMDFAHILDQRQGDVPLHHAVSMLDVAADMNPWVVLNSGFSGIFANHRANMAAAIGQARFQIDAAIKTLSS